MAIFLIVASLPLLLAVGIATELVILSKEIKNYPERFDDFGRRK